MSDTASIDNNNTNNNSETSPSKNGKLLNKLLHPRGQSHSEHSPSHSQSQSQQQRPPNDKELESSFAATNLEGNSASSDNNNNINDPAKQQRSDDPQGSNHNGNSQQQQQQQHRLRKSRNSGSEGKKSNNSEDHGDNNNNNNNNGSGNSGPISYKLSYDVGVAENKNSKYRSSMEDVHTYVANFVERLDWGYFAIFDGHAGKNCAKWCGQNLHLLLEKELLGNEQKKKKQSLQQQQQDTSGKKANFNEEELHQQNEDNEEDVRDCLDSCFQQADRLITQSSNNIGSSGCTAAVAIIRWELDEEYQSNVYQATTNNYKSKDFLPSENTPDNNNNNDKSSPNNRNTINGKSYVNENVEELQKKFDFVPSVHHKRMLYTANVGDSRLVLCRSGYAIRLSYDHKGSDVNESNRVMQAGGLIMKNRVNGVLAITRSLGDSYLKNLIIGRPYTTAIEVNENDEFLILACDGLWDIVSDQEAVDLIRDELDPNKQSKILVDHAMKNLSTDNITVMVIRFDQQIFGVSSSGKNDN